MEMSGTHFQSIPFWVMPISKLGLAFRSQLNRSDGTGGSFRLNHQQVLAKFFSSFLSLHDFAPDDQSPWPMMMKRLPSELFKKLKH